MSASASLGKITRLFGQMVTAGKSMFHTGKLVLSTLVDVGESR